MAWLSFLPSEFLLKKKVLYWLVVMITGKSIFHCLDILGVEIFCWVLTSTPWWMWLTLWRWISSNRQMVRSLSPPCPGQEPLSENLSPYLCIMAWDNCETISYPLCVKTNNSVDSSFCWKTFKHIVLEKVSPWLRMLQLPKSMCMLFVFLIKTAMKTF